MQCVLQNVTREFRRFLIDHDYTFTALLPVSGYLKNVEADDTEGTASNASGVWPLSDALVSTCDKRDLDVKFEVLHKALQQILPSSALSVSPLRESLGYSIPLMTCTTFSRWKESILCILGSPSFQNDMQSHTFRCTMHKPAFKTSHPVPQIENLQHLIPSRNQSHSGRVSERFSRVLSAYGLLHKKKVRAM